MNRPLPETDSTPTGVSPHQSDSSSQNILAMPEPRLRVFVRQMSAVIWIAVAWLTGAVVFELTGIGDETDYVQYETKDDSFRSPIDQPPVTDEVESDLGSL